MNWEPIIGLEIHAQLASKSKMFSGASTSYGAEVNTQACAIDLGFPGILPTINKQAIEMGIKFGLAIQAQIAKKSVFTRKNYFYPDLPKGYQISQLEQPLVSHGKINIQLSDSSNRTIHINRAHLEEDAGKSVHDIFLNETAIDLNRAGIPLIEIVSEPEIASVEEAIVYLKNIRSIVQYLDICDGNMQQGSFRCDANISVKPKHQKTLGTRVEIKNLNSFKFIEQAINYEITRQIDVISSGGTVMQETRLYDADKRETMVMRGKEEANDYRYFPDPDLLPVCIDQKMIDDLRKDMPELPNEKYQRFIRDYKLSECDSRYLTMSQDQAEYFEATVSASDGEVKLSANWIMGELSAFLHKSNIDIIDSPVTAVMLGHMIKRIKDKTISSKIAKKVFDAMWNGKGTTDQIIESQQLTQVTDTGTIQKLVEDVIIAHPDQVTQYQNSSADKQNKLISFFVGQIMKQSKGKANPQQVNILLKEKL